MKFQYDEEHVFENEEELKEFVINECDCDVLAEFLDDTYEGYEDNLNEWSPSDLYQYICRDGLESVREDEDLWEYLTDGADNYFGFDAGDYDGTEETCEIGGIEFNIIFEPHEIEEEDEEDE